VRISRNGVQKSYGGLDGSLWLAAILGDGWPRSATLPRVTLRDHGACFMGRAAPIFVFAVLGSGALGCDGGVEGLRDGLEAPDDLGGPTELGRDMGARGPTSCPLEVTPNVVDFGNVVAGTTATEVVEVMNTARFAVLYRFIRVSNVGICGRADGSVFCLASPTSDYRETEAFPLGAGETRRVELRFRPNPANGAADTEERAEFIWSVGAPRCDVRVQLRGSAVDSPLSCRPNTLDFGAVNPREAASAVVVCSAVADRAVTVSGATLSPESSPDFEQAPALEPALLRPPFDGNPGGAVTVPMAYAPTSLGDDRGRLIIEFEAEAATGSTVEVPILGRGGGPDIVVRRADIDFKRAALGIPSRRALLISNMGFEDLRYQFDVDTFGVGAFSIFEGESDVISPGETRLLKLEFRPEQAQVYETVARVETNDQDDPDIELRIRGEGVDLPACQLALDPQGSVLNFGTVDVAEGAVETFELRNVSPDDPCLVMGARLSEESDVEFRLVDGDVEDRLLAPLEVLPLVIEFIPSALGTYQGRLWLSVADPAMPSRTIDLVASVEPS